jgi:molecular chaperone GrpE
VSNSDSKKDPRAPLRGAPAADDATSGDGSSDSAADSATEAGADALELFRRDKDDLTRSLQRLQADFDNYRKRIERDRSAETMRATAAVIQGLLPVLDGFERALAVPTDPAHESYRQGFNLIYRSLRDALERLGLERIETTGKLFDPHLHQAVERVDSADHPDGAILAEMQTGYRFRDRVLRPAMVRVAVHPKSSAEGGAR